MRYLAFLWSILVGTYSFAELGTHGRTLEALPVFEHRGADQEVSRFERLMRSDVEKFRKYDGVTHVARTRPFELAGGNGAIDSGFIKVVHENPSRVVIYSAFAAKDGMSQKATQVTGGSYNRPFRSRETEITVLLIPGEHPEFRDFAKKLGLSWIEETHDLGPSGTESSKEKWPRVKLSASSNWNFESFAKLALHPLVVDVRTSAQ
jgi:hypothetical protein